MIYDLIIIGAGAAGLFSGAALPFPVNGLIIEKKAAAGRKLLLSGSGQCNLTHGGSIKDFISHYGKNGNQIRSILYRFNNLSVMDFFYKKGVPLFEREDNKIFPKSMKAQDILDVLLESCVQNGLQFRFSTSVDKISCGETFTVQCGNQHFKAKNLIISTGGCSYPVTGSDGSFFSVLEEIGIPTNPLFPTLVPIYADQYPYKNLSGISFKGAEVTIFSATKSKIAENKDALLLTHSGFSGPAILNLSRYAHSGDMLSINYYTTISYEKIVKDLSSSITGSSKQLLTILYEFFNRSITETASEIPRRFLESVCTRAGVDFSCKASRISLAQLKSIITLITHDDYKIQKLGGFEIAMVTAGGVPLSEINTKTMESKKYPNLFFAGEVLDIDGDTGGYNLQFAFSSGYLAAQNISPLSKL